jgi:hypothetical protein
MDDGNCKSSFALPGIIRNGAMKQVNRLGEDYFNDAMCMINFWPEKKFEQFFVREGFPPFSENPISI